MRKLATAVALASLTLLTACGGGSETDTPAASGDASSAAEETTEPGTEASTSPSASASASAGTGSEGGGTLLATVGEAGDPDAFVITLTDETGQPVEEIPAGEYTIEVSDPSTIHNFHLTGGAGVDESTTVPEQVETSWTVNLEPGEYTYVCDPHPRMVGEFSVTA